MKIKNFLAASFAVLAMATLMGCDANTKQIDQRYVWPAGLEGCKAYRLDPERGSILYVVRCPKSDVSTTFSTGKSSTGTVVTSEE